MMVALLVAVARCRSAVWQSQLISDSSDDHRQLVRIQPVSGRIR